jgi:hypothetical protein
MMARVAPAERMARPARTVVRVALAHLVKPEQAVKTVQAEQVERKVHLVLLVALVLQVLTAALEHQVILVQAVWMGPAV